MNDTIFQRFSQPELTGDQATRSRLTSVPAKSQIVRRNTVHRRKRKRIIQMYSVYNIACKQLLLERDQGALTYSERYFLNEVGRLIAHTYRKHHEKDPETQLAKEAWAFGGYGGKPRNVVIKSFNVNVYPSSFVPTMVSLMIKHKPANVIFRPGTVVPGQG